MSYSIIGVSPLLRMTGFEFALTTHLGAATQVQPRVDEVVCAQQEHEEPPALSHDKCHLINIPSSISRLTT